MSNSANSRINVNLEEFLLFGGNDDKKTVIFLTYKFNFDFFNSSIPPNRGNHSILLRLILSTDVFPLIPCQELKLYEDEEVDKTDAKFKTMIPSPLTFQIIEQIIPCMEKACQLSEMLSADDKPTIHQVFLYF